MITMKQKRLMIGESKIRKQRRLTRVSTFVYHLEEKQSQSWQVKRIITLTHSW